MVERTFGVWKQRFQILRNVPRYSYEMQTALIVACAVLHNFILKHARQDDVILSNIDSVVIDDPDEEDPYVEFDDATNLRTSITAQMWEGRNNGI